MDLQYIYSTFKNLNSNQQKIEFLQQLQSYNLHYNINYENLINYYRTH